jgi:hypothetical protein
MRKAIILISASASIIGGTQGPVNTGKMPEEIEKGRVPHAPFLVRMGPVLQSVLHDFVDHGRVGEGCGIAKLIDFAGGDFPEDPSHDLARPRLR